MAPSRPTGKPGSNVAAILDDAETQLAVGNIEAAINLAEQALENTGPKGDFALRALNQLGAYRVENGDIEEAWDVLLKATRLDEDGMVDEKVGGGPDKFLLLAQISEAGGKDSVDWFIRGAEALRVQLAKLSEITTRTSEQEFSYLEKQQKLGATLCSVAEVYMTDLSWEDDAETRCEALITEAMMLAPNSPETWQTVANVRISQGATEEAQGALKRSLALWEDLPPEHPAVPEFPTRISLTRLLLEVEMEDNALSVLDRLVTDDDQSVEAWYLGGWCQYIQGEKLRDGGGKSANGNEGTSDNKWKSTWSSARRWLATSLKLYEVQEYEDERLGEHAIELFQSINSELGEPPEQEDEESDDDNDDDEDKDSGSDEEMHN